MPKEQTLSHDRMLQIQLAREECLKEVERAHRHRELTGVLEQKEKKTLYRLQGKLFRVMLAILLFFSFVFAEQTNLSYQQKDSSWLLQKLQSNYLFEMGKHQLQNWYQVKKR